MSPSPPGATFSLLLCLNYQIDDYQIDDRQFNARIEKEQDMNLNLTRRMFAMRFASVLSALGITSAVWPPSGMAQTSAAPEANGHTQRRAQLRAGCDDQRHSGGSA